jgi:hypothetical protein
MQHSSSSSTSSSSSSSSSTFSSSSASSSDSSDSDDDELPAGWFAADDELGRRYYWSERGEPSSWLPPQASLSPTATRMTPPAAVVERDSASPRSVRARVQGARSFWTNLERETNAARRTTPVRRPALLRRSKSAPSMEVQRSPLRAAISARVQCTHVRSPATPRSPVAMPAPLRRARTAPISSDTVQLALERSRNAQRRTRTARRNRTADASVVRRLKDFSRAEQGRASVSPLRCCRSSSSSAPRSPDGSRLFQSAMGRGGGGGGEAARFPNGVRDLVFRSRIGLGTFSTVKLATLATTGERVAVKCLSLPKIRALQQETNALRELRVLKAMSGIGALGASGARHPLVVAVCGALRDGLSLYIVLELCGGGDLEARLDAVERFAEEDAQFYAGSIALGLAALHARGFCYRDLKPENVLLAYDGSFLLFTVTFYANHAHNLTRSP